MSPTGVDTSRKPIATSLIVKVVRGTTLLKSSSRSVS